jgi:hypothetical protein
MAKSPEKEIEFHPDAMERFERAVKVVAKNPPQHRVSRSSVKSLCLPVLHQRFYDCRYAK